MSAFDVIQNHTFDIINMVMGDDVRWVSLSGEVLQEAKALYNHPSESGGISDTDYETDEYSIEYKQGDLPGLKEAVNGRETVYVEVLLNGIWVKHWAQRMEAKYDGKTLIAFLSAPNEI